MDSETNTATATVVSLHSGLPVEEQSNHNVLRFCMQFDFFHFIAFVFLTYNVVLSIIRSRGNPWDTAFVISCYVELILLFLCLKKRESLGADAPAEQIHRLKIVVWVLTTLLTLTFAYRVSLIMPLSLKIVIWGMSGSVIAAGFYAFFIFDKDVQGTNGYGKLDNAEEQENLYHNQLSPEEKV